MLIYAAVVFFLVTLASITLLTWLVPNKSQRRLQELAQPAEKSDWVKTVVGLASPLAKLSIPEGKWGRLATPGRIHQRRHPQC